MRHFSLFPIIALIMIIVIIGCTTEAPILPRDEANVAITGIEGYSEVLDAAISQRNQTLSLVLIVVSGLSEVRAKELGDNFVRIVKTFGPDEVPGKEIGQGLYNYLIGVYYPGEIEVALGAKASNSIRIRW